MIIKQQPHQNRSMLILQRLSYVFLLAKYASGFLNSPRERRAFAWAKHLVVSGPPQSSRLLVAVNGGDSSSTTRASASKEAWKDVQLPHAHIAEKSRKDFTMLTDRTVGEDKPLVYLDSAATSQKPEAVLRTLSDYYRTLNSNVHRGAHTLSREATDAYEQARDKVKHFIGATSRNEIVFTSGATEAINLVAQSYGRAFLEAGDEIVLTVAEHHSNLVPWQMLAAEKGVVLKFVELEGGGLNLQHLYTLLSDKTKLVSFQHVSNVLGCINPVDEIVKMIRETCPADCKILLDACQSVPHMPVNVADLGVDFLAASGHKMCGPTGIGFLWGREALLNQMPPWKGGGEMIDQVTLTASTWQPAPARFEAGTPAIAQAIGLGAAIDYLTAIGMDKINAYEHELADYLYTRLSQVPGISILGPTHPGARAALCAFSHDTVHPSDLSTFLDMEGVAIRAGHHCCQPLHHSIGISHSTRASLYFYNTKEYVAVERITYLLFAMPRLTRTCRLVLYTEMLTLLLSTLSTQ
jgi:cysteine desulfurase / selenocysteine lyase